MSLLHTLRGAKAATQILSTLTLTQRNEVLESMASSLIGHKDEILQANACDLQNTHNLSQSLQKRLELNADKIHSMAHSLRQIATLKDPINRILEGWEMPSGIRIEKVSVPLGVVGVIYESRPNVTSDVSALCFKSGNVCVLKGGKEALHSNTAILRSLHAALEEHNLPLECINMISTHEEVAEFLRQDTYIDLLIPRGGERLIKYVQQHSTIPIIKHDKGVCHLYIHKEYNLEYATAIAIDAKVRYPAACNAIETLLVDSVVAGEVLPHIAQALRKEGTSLMGDSEVGRIIALDGEADYTQEYGTNTLNIKIVSDLYEAIDHINTFGSQHSDSIITNDIGAMETFLNNVQSACVYANASTRFSDGGEFGFGAEVGISTNKLHARGPMGIESLTTYKYKITALGAVRG